MDKLKYYVGVTDLDWFNFLSRQNPEDVNFWQPGGSSGFKILRQGEPFLFKLKAPINAIAGVGFFSSHTFLPISIAWEAFGIRNGCEHFEQLADKIRNYRNDKETSNPVIGCIVLTNPIFFDKKDWIAAPENWAKSIVQGKSYDTSEEIGASLWARVNKLIEQKLSQVHAEDLVSNQVTEEAPLYGKSVLTKVRLGQGAFRVMVTDAYGRKCSMSGERTLPVLEAAHIRPFAENGPHAISNSLLLRSDLHKLFDTGYITITKEHQIEVSTRIKLEFENGRDYYKYQGSRLVSVPSRPIDRPKVEYIEWHNTNIYKG